MAARRIAITGGPGAGKTTALDLFARELGPRVAVVPESATLLYRGGFPRSDQPRARTAAQRAIFRVQHELEDAIGALHPQRVLLCDRGSVDGAAYWPGPPAEYFAAMGSSLDAELGRYQAVLFLESGAVGGLAPAGDPGVRTESVAQAAALDGALRRLWERHPHFVRVAHDTSFFRKIAAALQALARLVGET